MCYTKSYLWMPRSAGGVFFRIEIFIFFILFYISSNQFYFVNFWTFSFYTKSEKILIKVFRYFLVIHKNLAISENGASVYSPPSPLFFLSILICFMVFIFFNLLIQM